LGTHQELRETKTVSSKATVPLPFALLAELKESRGNLFRKT
jgi:hypothetical protein